MPPTPRALRASRAVLPSRVRCRCSALREKSSPLWTSCLQTGGIAENEAGGYQYRTVVQVLDKKVETMLDGCAGANHITEELLMGMLNRAAELGIGTNDRRFPVVCLEKWVHPEFVHGIAFGAPVPLKGAAVLWVTLLKGKTSETARPGPEIFVRCKIAAHGLILDCAGRMGLGFKPGPETHVLDTLGVQIPRCEDLTRTRKDRAYAFEARLSSLDSPTSREPGGEDREFLRFDGEESLELAPGDGVLVPVRRGAKTSADDSLSIRGRGVLCGGGPRALADRSPGRVRPPCCN